MQTLPSTYVIGALRVSLSEEEIRDLKAVVPFTNLQANVTRMRAIISHLSTHPFKYATCFSAQFFQQKWGLIFYRLNMSCKVICCECMNFSCLTIQFPFVNISLKRFKWSSQFIIQPSNSPVWTSEQSNWSSMSRTMICRASKPLKPATLLDSTSFSIGWISSSLGGSPSIYIVSKTSLASSNITSKYFLLFVSSNDVCLLDAFSLLKFATN